VSGSASSGDLVVAASPWRRRTRIARPTDDRGFSPMQMGPLLLAYFGPEMQLPLTSLIGAISGVILIVGGSPIRLIRRWSSTLGRGRRSP
jgi:hypothetical protein